MEAPPGSCLGRRVALSGTIGKDLDSSRLSNTYQHIQSLQNMRRACYSVMFLLLLILKAALWAPTFWAVSFCHFSPWIYPSRKKNMAALVTSTLHLPQANPKNKIPYTKLNSITENRKKQKKKKKTKIPEKGWGAHSCWIFVFLFFLFFFWFFSGFVCFFGGFCLLYRLSIGVVLPWKCFLHISWTARPNSDFLEVVALFV